MLRRSGTLRTDQDPSSMKGLGIILLLLALLLSVGVGAYLYLYTDVVDKLMSQDTEQSANITPTTEPTPLPEDNITPTLAVSPTLAATPTPEPTIAVTAHTIQILNGNGVAGSAGGASTVLQQAGYKIASTANATTFDFQNTVIRAKSSVPARYLEAMKIVLSSKYTVTIETTLDANNETDVVVIVGAK